MRSSSSYAAATLKHDLSEPPSVLNHRTPEGCPKFVSDPLTYYIRAAGVLRYNRESDNHRMNLTTIHPASQALTGYPMKCEYCGKEAQPSLDLTWAEWPKMVFFCCAQWQRLCTILLKLRRAAQERCDPRTVTPTTSRNKSDNEKEKDELLLKSKEMKDHHKLFLELTRRTRQPSDLISLPTSDIVADPTSNSFRLSCAPLDGCWTVYPCEDLKQKEEEEEEEEKVSLPFCDHNTLSFGIYHHQHGAELLQKYYSNGMTFLTVFPDGSAQVFYPSGLLALAVVVTERNGRVCMVYDDSEASDQPMRALFQSDGRATCYHSNRNIWLTLNSSGGQCLDEAGARVRRWRWSSLDITPTPLYPVFLSLNETVGVRVFGKEHVFVSFLARGQQVKVSVGSCCAQDKCKTVGVASGAAVLMEDLFVKVARIRIHLVIQHLHQYLMTPSCTRLPKTKQAAHLRVVAQQLLEVSADVMMAESERTFIRRCLQLSLKYQ